MQDKIFIIGHVSPDLDSIVAAISYANFKNKINGNSDFSPARAGELNRETIYVLEKFKIAVPELIGNIANREVILVDHNEFSQAAEGAEEAKIMEIIDHHKMNFKYTEPIEIIVKPWGSSCSIIADLYFKHNIEIEKDLAGAMLAAILVDTVITKSPTSTINDREIIEKLAKIAQTDDWQSFGMEIFKIRSSVFELTDDEIIKSDFKDFIFKAGKFGIGQVETVDLNDFSDREDGLMAGLNDIKTGGGYKAVILFITDIIKEGSRFLVVGDDMELISKAFGAKLENGKVYIDGILSRKKQVVPVLSEVFDS
jgi:manganese-dependent inorganic pyrophosphatase